MSDDSKSFEKKLDRDFLYYLNLTKELFENIKEESEQQLCEVWLTHLFGKTVTSLAEKCNRNIYLSRLLLQMQNGKLSGIFLGSPSDGPLPCAFKTFNVPTEVDGLKMYADYSNLVFFCSNDVNICGVDETLTSKYTRTRCSNPVANGFEEMGFQIDSSIGGGSGDFSKSSRDGRTYLATRHLPQGVMAFMAVTNNEEEPVWVPQTSPTSRPGSSENKVNLRDGRSEGYTKKLLDYIDVPLSQLRKSPEEREQVLEWMDKIIGDCNKWIQGEDPHNMELEQLFETLYEEYKKDPENSELLNHPRSVRTILFKDIRDKINERRAEVSKREMILDFYESDQYSEITDANEYIDDVWLECAKKPLKDSVKSSLENVYPQEVVQRFTELLFQERLQIITKAEKQAKKKISELRKASIEDTKMELQKLKKAQNEYKEYYCVYREIEDKLVEFEKEYKEKCNKSDKLESNQQNLEKYKQKIDIEIQQAKRNFDKELKAQYELREKLEEAKEAYRRVKERMAAETDKLNCEINQLSMQKEELEKQVCVLKKRRDEMKNKFPSPKSRFC